MGEVKKNKKIKKERSRASIWIENIIEILIMVVCITFSIITISNPGGVNEDYSKISVNSLPVLSNSMSGTFEEGDLIFGKKVKRDSEGKAEILDIGKVAIFVVNDKNISEYQFLNTHRIVGYRYEYSINNGTDIKNFSGYADMLRDPSVKNYETAKQFADNKGWINFKVIGYVTAGDNKSIYYKDGNVNGELKNPANTYVVDAYVPTIDQVIGTWEGGKVAALGGVITWVKEPTHFFFVVLLPLGILFLLNVFTIIKYIIDIKTEKAKKLALEEVQSLGTTPVIDEEEIKRKAIEEYLKKQEAENASKEEKEDK